MHGLTTMCTSDLQEEASLYSIRAEHITVMQLRPVLKEKRQLGLVKMSENVVGGCPSCVQVGPPRGGTPTRG